MNASLRSFRPLRAASRQRGVVLIYSLVGMVIILVSGLALLRGMNTSMFISGNYALRRDMINEGEQGVSAAIATFSGTGALATATSRTTSLVSSNYSATTLATDNNGIPTALLSDSTFATYGSTSNDITPESGVFVRYIIDRICVSGTTTPSIANCSAYKGTQQTGGNLNGGGAGNGYTSVYRITVRVTGPKNSMTFLQTTVGA
jgi:Tfp pilus assembly protein PilX